MGILDKLFKSESDNTNEKKSQVPWNDLNSTAQLEELKAESKDKPVAILKHSTRCGISKMVLRQFENSYDLSEDADIKLYFLDLLSYREVSNEIAERFSVRHESPQLIVLKDENVVHHSSHQGIDADKLKEFLN
ncbi:bacillithiol system redox-active protein YtxJ [Salegentibacter chungangensis]|uniref:Bacillithiol system redox-active protein YtxJ n=1 Tax=Salegentibacter chungangensis TaxID=1335724 RepID=A0ABW3NSD0_9FLAO